MAKAGLERWPVKVGLDSLAAAIDITHPTPTTIAEMRAFPAPPNPDALVYRWGQVEKTAYSLTAELVQAHVEADGDIHAVLMDENGNTLIAEVPDPTLCAGSAWLVQIAHTRGAFEALFGKASSTWVRPRVQVTVSGVGFFDKKHNQAGCAVNGVELHAVLSLMPA